MQHRGEIVKEAVYKSGIAITDLAKRMGKSRRWVYQMFENSNVSLDVVLQVGKIIHHDFSDDIKEFNPFLKFNEPSSTYEKEEQNTEYWKNKYLKLLEEYNELLKTKP